MDCNGTYPEINCWIVKGTRNLVSFLRLLSIVAKLQSSVPTPVCTCEVFPTAHLLICFLERVHKHGYLVNSNLLQRCVFAVCLHLLHGWENIHTSDHPVRASQRAPLVSCDYTATWLADFRLLVPSWKNKNSNWPIKHSNWPIKRKLYQNVIEYGEFDWSVGFSLIRNGASNLKTTARSWFS